MVEHQPSKLDTWVRFPSPASITQTLRLVMFIYKICASGSAVEHLLAKEGVAGSIPVSRFNKKGYPIGYPFLLKHETHMYISITHPILEGIYISPMHQITTSAVNVTRVSMVIP